MNNLLGSTLIGNTLALNSSVVSGDFNGPTDSQNNLKQAIVTQNLINRGQAMSRNT